MGHLTNLKIIINEKKAAINEHLVVRGVLATSLVLSKRVERACWADGSIRERPALSARTKI